MPALNIVVKGIVQGVGFRPFIYQQAHLYKLTGHVKNNSSGVSIHLEGDTQNITSFLDALVTQAPPLSKVEEVLTLPSKIEGYTYFSILQSNIEEGAPTLLSPDIAVCPDCLGDLNAIGDTRRYHYAFTNCTNCGPRFSIIKGLPYDRPSTTMYPFSMCPSCKEEYENPLDRRFHAQPTCCKECGPKLSLISHTGTMVLAKDPIAETRLLLKAGYIIAVKGLGGFHLLCDGTSGSAINLLRTRKNRPTKPLALMMKDLGTVLQYCCFDAKEQEILLGNKKPILLLKKKNKALPHNISFDNPYLGIMLPYTPLHYMLFDETLTVVVATSANHFGMPMLFENDKAFEALRDVADYFLVHDRDIHIPVDDSVVKITLGETHVIRNARGYAPSCFHITSNEVLALGSELKNTFCISKENLCFMSPYIGDLSNVETLRLFTHNVNHFKELYNINPKVIAYDYHPSFSYHDELKDYSGQKIGIYHHHAHIASCLAENKVNEQVIGIAFDGAGYGEDGMIWGSEFLICDTKDFKRSAHLSYFKMPGGDQATLWPWRMAVSFLYEAFGEELSDFLPDYLCDAQIAPLLSLLKNDTFCPLCCSMGRLFDGVAALLGFKSQISYEGEAAVYLETLACMSTLSDCAYHFILKELDDVWIIDYISLIQQLAHDLKTGLLPPFISRKFHNTISFIALEVCQRLRTQFLVNQVALSGGVFQNELLFSKLYHLLIKHDFKVYTHKVVPCNDSGLSLGQLVIASRQIRM